jgi:hypothetical protein
VLPFIAVVVIAACVAASIKRLRMAIAPTPIDPRPLVEVLRGKAGERNVRSILRALADAEGGSRDDLTRPWECELARAMEAPHDERVARVNELLTELDFTVQSWARVPRVCASIAASTGFLLASLALRRGLGVAEDLPLDVQELAIRGAVRDGIDVAAVGICGAIICITLGYQASKAARARLAATDELVERLEALAAAPSRLEASEPPVGLSSPVQAGAPPGEPRDAGAPDAEEAH